MLSKNELVRINNSTLVEESERGTMRKVEIGNYLVTLVSAKPSATGGR